MSDSEIHPAVGRSNRIAPKIPAPQWSDCVSALEAMEAECAALKEEEAMVHQRKAALRDEAAAFRATLATLRQYDAVVHQGLGGLPAFDFLS